MAAENVNGDSASGITAANAAESGASIVPSGDIESVDLAKLLAENIGRPAAYAEYAMSVGWDVIPLHYVNEAGACSCDDMGCSSPGKHPIEGAWQTGTRMTKDRAARWWGEGMPYNIGIVTGPRSGGLVVLDVDPLHGGDDDFKALVTEIGELPTTRIHRTGSGGRHYIFKAPTGLGFEISNSNKGLKRFGGGKGLDVRGKGGFIVAPGSVSSRGAYASEDAADPAELPAALVEILRPKAIEPTQRASTSVPGPAWSTLDPAQQDRARAYLDSAVGGEISRLDAMKRAADPAWTQANQSGYEGEPWNVTTFEVCCNLLELAQSDWLDFSLDDVRGILTDHAPTDATFTMATVLGCLASAQATVEGKNRSMPASITGDGGWALMTAGLPSHAPRDSESGEAARGWPPEQWDQNGNANRTVRLTAGRLALVTSPGDADWMECRADGIWISPDVAVRDDVPAKWCARAMKAARTLEAHNYSDQRPKNPTKANPDAEGDSERDKFMKFMDTSSKVEMHSAVATLLRRQAEDLGIQISAAEFNKDPHVFAAANGLIDLRTGDLRAIRLDDRISIASPVAYDPGMPIPHFQRFLETSHPDPEVRDYLQLALGYSMFGDNPESKMHIHHAATTANGKSTLLRLLGLILGGHMKPAPSKALIKQKVGSGAIGQDLVDMRGARFLSLSETAEGAMLDVEIVKSVTGGDARSDRAHHKGNTTSTITGKIHLMTNHLPHVTPDDAMRRRVVVVPWTQSFKDNPDQSLDANLASEAPGIFAWLVQGARRWWELSVGGKRRVLDPPELIRRATEEMFEGEDEVQQWIAERCMTLDAKSALSGWETVSALYADYKNWRFSSSLNGQAIGSKTFGDRLSSKGYEAKVTSRAGASARVRPLRLANSVVDSL